VGGVGTVVGGNRTNGVTQQGLSRGANMVTPNGEEGGVSKNHSSHVAKEIEEGRPGVLESQV